MTLADTDGCALYLDRVTKRDAHDRAVLGAFIREVRARIWAWDPAGLVEAGVPEDEYDCLVGPSPAASGEVCPRPSWRFISNASCWTNSPRSCLTRTPSAPSLLTGIEAGAQVTLVDPEGRQSQISDQALGRHRSRSGTRSWSACRPFVALKANASFTAYKRGPKLAVSQQSAQLSFARDAPRESSEGFHDVRDALRAFSIAEWRSEVEGSGNLRWQRVKSFTIQYGRHLEREVLDPGRDRQVAHQGWPHPDEQSLQRNPYVNFKPI